MDMGMRSGTRLLLAAATLLFSTSAPVAAQSEAAAGRFIVVSGDVRILGRDGMPRVAERGGEFRQGEAIVTGANGLAQLRMSDGGAISVRADTQLKLDVYRYTGSEDRESSFFASILKGGFRTITGLIARNNRENYRIATSSVTIGVRGTHFEVVHVLQPMADTAAGTYSRVYDGIMSLQNRAGAAILVSREQTGFAALAGNLPPVLVVPPAGIFGRPTPVPVVTPQARRDGDGQADGSKPAARVLKDAPGVRETAPATTVAPSRALTAPLLNPMDTPTTTISPTLMSPTTTTISPATTTISPILTAPATTTIQTAPTTTTISPILTAPATTTIQTAPTTTTISPILTAPTTTIQTAPSTSTIIKR